MSTTRRDLITGAIAALSLPGTALADVPCDPPAYRHWTGRREVRWRDDLGPAGFVNYYGEPCPFDAKIVVETESYPTCGVYGAERSTFERGGRLREAVGALDGRTTNCSPWPSDNQHQFEAKVAWLYEELRRAAPEPTAGVRLTAVGSHHSSSDVYQRLPDGRAVVLHIEGINHVLVDQPEWDEDFLARRPDRHHAMVGAGVQICQLNEALWRMGLALETQGSFDGQTLAGAISTGTHGAGIAEGAVADSVEAVVLITCVRDPKTDAPTWTVLQIEPDPVDAITRPDRFRAERAGVPWRLVQDSRLFEATLVAMGTMGVIVGYVMRVRPAYFLVEVRSGRPWSELRGNLLERASVAPVGFSNRGWRYEIVVSPSKIRDTDDWAVTEVLRDAWDYDVNYNEDFRSIPQKWAGGLTRSVNLGGAVGRDVADLANQGLVRGKRLGSFADRCYRVLKLGQGEYVQAWGTEFMVPAELGADMVDWVLQTNPTLGDLARGKRRNQRLLNPFGVRFSTGRRGFLSMVRWRRNGEAAPVCTCELTEPVKDHRDRNLGVRANGKPSSKAIIEFWAEKFIERFGADGRLHWGQVQGDTAVELLANSYPKDEVDAWFDAFRTLNPYGLFDTRFAERLGFVARRASESRPAPRYRGLGRPLDDLALPAE